jgi:hypothetical protein
MTCAFVIEEGFRIDKLDQIAEAMAKTADEAGVRLVAGDTKVAGKGTVRRRLHHDNRRRGDCGRCTDVRRLRQTGRCRDCDRGYRPPWDSDPAGPG